MKESIRDRILLYVYEQEGDKHEFVELQDFFKSLATTSWYIGEDLRGISTYRNRLLEVEPFGAMQKLGKKDRTVTIENTSFRAKLTAAGIAEVKRMLAEDTSVELTKAQLKDFPRMSWQSRWGFWLAVIAIVIAASQLTWDILKSTKQDPSPAQESQSTSQTQTSTKSNHSSQEGLHGTAPDTTLGKK
jgi:hypothetical protein